MKNKLFYLAFFISLVLLSSGVVAQETDLTADDVNNGITYQAHVCNLGWLDPVSPDKEAGTTGKSLRMEAFNIKSDTVQLQYSAHVQDIGWQKEVTTGENAGTTNQKKAVEAIKISLLNAPNVDIYYRAHSANFGWLGWAKNGEVAGTTGCGFPIEAIQIIAVPKDAEAPGDTENATIDRSQFKLQLRTHVKNVGWTEYVNGSVSGTTGKKLSVEAIDLKLVDPTGKSAVVGQAYIRNIGWQNAAKKNDAIGTTGKGLPIEAYHYKLVGPASELFDISYRSHSSNIGWMGWTKNDKLAGTKNGALPVEAVDIVLTRKGAAPDQANAYKDIQIPLHIIPPAPTCIVINKGLQRMAYYENYNVVVDTNVVTGMSWVDDTLAGDFSVLEKLSPYRTVGPGYDAVVRYWLTLYRGRISGFNGEGTIVDRVGIHDASWRTDWSGRAYTYTGSHGCVNTPFNAMQTIYTRVPQGAPVRIR